MHSLIHIIFVIYMTHYHTKTRSHPHRYLVTFEATEHRIVVLSTRHLFDACQFRSNALDLCVNESNNNSISINYCTANKMSIAFFGYLFAVLLLHTNAGRPSEALAGNGTLQSLQVLLHFQPFAFVHTQTGRIDRFRRVATLELVHHIGTDFDAERTMHAGR